MRKTKPLSDIPDRKRQVSVVHGHGAKMTRDSAAPPEPDSAVPEELAAGTSSSLWVTQCRAMKNMMSGQSMSAAARAAGVGRATLYRWMNEDANFRAAYNAWQRDTIAAARGSVVSLAEPALRAVAAAVEAGDVKAGLAVLKSLGLLTPPKPGSTDAEDVKKEQEIERKRKERDLFAADLEAGMPA